MTARTIIIRQVASKHSNFVVTEYISCRRPSLMFSTLFWMRKMLMSANLVWRDLVKSWFREEWKGGAYRQLGQLNEICWSRYRPYSSWHSTLHTAASLHSHNTSTRISRPRESKHLDDGWQGRYRRRGYKLALHKGRNLVWFCVAVEYSSEVKAMSLCVLKLGWI